MQLLATDGICTHHLSIFTIHYTKNNFVNRYCLDPFQVHKALLGKNLVPLHDQIMYNLLTLHKKHHNGQKICRNCIQRVKTAVEELASQEDNLFRPEPTEMGEDMQQQSVSQLNRSISALTTPIKLDQVVKLPKRRRVDYIEAKAEKLKEGFRAALSETVGAEAHSQSSVQDDLGELMQMIKVKLKVVSRREQVRLLTLVPTHSPREKVAHDFGVSVRQVREARELREHCGILAELPATKKGNKTLDNDIVSSIKSFYTDSDFVRPMPGAKQVVACRQADGSKVYEAQRLILCDLLELYNHFCMANPSMSSKVKKSKFCELRPKYCKTVSSTGTHSVCVCVIHQNFKFLVEKIPGVKHYTEIIQLLVCEESSAACMLRKCDRCPGKDAVEHRLSTLFEESEFDTDDQVTYSQWTTVDRSNIVTHSSTVGELIDLITKQVEELTTHQYIKDQQSIYLKNLKANLPPNEIIVQMDFAENYAFIVQDASQSFHWNNLQATLHPIVVYYLSQDKSLAHISFVYISD